MVKKVQEEKKSNLTKACSIAFVALVALGCIIGFVGEDKKDSDSHKKTETTSIEEAQLKCMLMEESDMVNYMGEPLNEQTRKKAEEHCLSGWDMRKNPENTEEKFIETTNKDWEMVKDEVMEGYTLQQYFDEATK